MNNKNNNNNKNNYIIKLYNSVWNNIVIKKIILDHLTKFNMLSMIKFDFSSYKQWQECKYKQYLKSISLWPNFQNQLCQPLPDNIQNVQLPVSKSAISESVISYLSNVKSICAPWNYDKYFNCQFIYSITCSKISSQFDTLLLDGDIDELSPNRIPKSITNLSISSTRGKIQLHKGVLPNNLKVLKLNCCVFSFENGCLPESLTYVDLNESITTLIRQLSFSKCLVTLVFTNSGSIIDETFQFPNTLQKLVISCRLFGAKLPNNLKCFELCVSSYKYEIVLPPTLQTFRFCVISDKDYRTYQENSPIPTSVTDLTFNCPSILDAQNVLVLPNKLKKLVLKDSFNKELLVNQLPSSLTYLDMGLDFNQVIDINVLPSNLKTLILGSHYSRVINPLAIPQSLELLHIKNQNYIYPIRLTPSSHPNTAISCEDITLYYSPSNTQLRVLRLPNSFESPLSTISLQDKCNLEYLYLGEMFNHQIKPTDLPSPNNIKTIVISNASINLEDFQNLETIVIITPQSSSRFVFDELVPIITTTSTTDYDNNTTYNFYKLKNIIVSPNYRQFIKKLDSSFYQFLKTK